MSVTGRTPNHHGHQGGRDGESRTAGAPEPALSYAVGRALGTVVVTVHGDIDLEGSEALERVLDDLVDGQGNRAVAVDLRKARILSDEALDVFYAIGHRARRRGTSFTVTAPADTDGPDVTRVEMADVIKIDRPPKHRS